MTVVMVNLLACLLFLVLVLLGNELWHAPVILIVLGALWVYRTLGDMLTSIVSNSNFGKRSAARDMAIVGSHFLPSVTEKCTF